MTHFYFAPMEGITDAVYRRVHRRFYPGIEKYYTPFISPTHHHLFTPRQLRELDGRNNENVPLVPQLLGKNAEDFLWAAQALADMGYTEVNLNLGCPSGTVTAKGKGSGFLAHPEELDRFLDTIYAAAPLAVSIKTRLGLTEPEEFFRLLPIYNKYPVCELTIHPRTKTQMYQGDVHWDSFAWAMEHTTLPLCYNGNLMTQGDCDTFRTRFPQVDHLMLGRGLVADPALVARMSGQDADRARLRRFHDALCQEYPVVFESHQNAMHRMKAIWAYMLPTFQGGESYRKKIIKARTWADLMAVADEIFTTLPLAND